VTRMGDAVFLSCPGLLSATFLCDDVAISNLAFAECGSLENVQFPGKCPSIGIQAFKDCLSLTSITIPDEVRRIGQGAFENCSSLEPDGMNGVRCFEHACFRDSGISRLQLSCTEDLDIQDDAFNGCPNLASVDIEGPINLTVRRFALAGNVNLKHVLLRPETAYFCEGAFANNGALTTVAIPVNTKMEGAVFYGADNNRCLLLHGTSVDLSNPKGNWREWGDKNPKPDSLTFVDDFELIVDGEVIPQVAPWPEFRYIWVDPNARCVLPLLNTWGTMCFMQRAAPNATTWAAVELWLWWSPPTGAGYTNRAGDCKDKRTVCETRRAALIATTLAGFEAAKSSSLPVLPPPVWLVVFSFLKHDQMPVYA